MSNIEQNLQKILSSRYGKDVRQAIHDGIHDCYEDGKAGAIDIFARESIESTKNQLDARISNIIANSSDTGDNSELIDIRTGYDGRVYRTAGDAIRQQIDNSFTNRGFLRGTSEKHIDLNTIIKSGAYVFNCHVGFVDNGPEGVTGNPSLFVIRNVFTERYVAQLYTTSNSTRIYYRYFNPNNLEDPANIDWVILNDPFYLINNVSKPATLSSFIETGVYGFKGPYYTDAPSKNGIKSASTMFVYRNSFAGPYVTQFAIFTKCHSKIWLRFFNPSNPDDKENVDWTCINPDPVIPEKPLPWDGKSIVCLGDSTTYGDTGMESGSRGPSISWTSHLTNLCGFSEVTNKGINGTTYTKVSSITTSFCERVNNLPESDVYIVMGGINDFNYGRPLGKFGDEVQTTFYGAVDYVIKTILSNHPSSILYVFLPIKFKSESYRSDSTNTIGLKYTDYVNAIKEVCDKYSVQILDLYTRNFFSPFIDEQKSLYTGDGLHLNIDGYKKLAEYRIAPFLNSSISVTSEIE